MESQFSIDPRTGNIAVGQTHLRRLQSKTEIVPQIAPFIERSRDHGNGYEWLYLKDLTFGGRPASLGLCFHEGRLRSASWSVRLQNVTGDSGWPSPREINEEIVFVRSILADTGLKVGKKPATFAWGEVWSSFDAKASVASHGLRYRGNS